MQPYWSTGVHDDYYRYLTEYISPHGDAIYLTSLKWCKHEQCNKAICILVVSQLGGADQFQTNVFTP